MTVAGFGDSMPYLISVRKNINTNSSIRKVPVCVEL